MICVNMYHTSYNVFVYCISCHIIPYHTIEFISGWWFQPLWKIWKSVGMIIPNIWKKTCSKPPTRYIHSCFITPEASEFWTQGWCPSSSSSGILLRSSQRKGYCTCSRCLPCQWGACQKQQQWSPVSEYEGPALSQISNKYEDSNHLQLAKKNGVKRKDLNRLNLLAIASNKNSTGLGQFLVMRDYQRSMSWLD